MAKIRKAVFRSGIVMLSLLAAIVLSSSVAYAQVRGAGRYHQCAGNSGPGGQWFAPRA